MEDSNIVRSGNQDMSLTDIPERITPDAIFQQIDVLRDAVNDVPPSLMERMLSQDARARSSAIEEAKIAAIRSRTALIQGLSTSLNVYVQTHSNHFKLTSAGFLTRQLGDQVSNLGRASEGAIISFLETYSASVDRIHQIRHLTEDQRKVQVDAAYGRALRSGEQTGAAFQQILNRLKDQVDDMIRQVGKL